MNSKIKKFLSVLSVTAVAAAGVFSLAACDGDGKQGADETKVPTEVTLAGFESYEDGLQMMRMLQGFGKISLNDNKTYVSQGEKSAKLQVQGLVSGSRKPECFIPFSSKYFEYDYCNLLKVKSVSFDIYNASDSEKQLISGIVTAHKLNSSITGCMEEKVMLKPGWNSIVVPIDHDSLARVMDVTQAEGYFFRFMREYNVKLDECPTFYLDNFKLNLCDEVTLSEVRPSLVAADFEDEFEKYFISSDLDIDWEIVRAEKGVSPRSGLRMLHIYNTADIHEANGNVTWGRISLNAKAMQAALKAVDHPERAYFEFEVYNNSPVPYNSGMSVDYYLEKTGGKVLAAAEGGGTLNLIQGKWVKYSLPISKVMEKSEDWFTGAGKVNMFYKAQQFDFYMDNFRIVEK